MEDFFGTPTNIVDNAGFPIRERGLSTGNFGEPTEKALSLRATSQKLLRVDGSLDIIPEPYYGPDGEITGYYYQKMLDGDIDMATDDSLVTKKMVEQAQNNLIISKGAFALRAGKGVNIEELAPENLTFKDFIRFSGWSTPLPDGKVLKINFMDNFWVSWNIFDEDDINIFDTTPMGHYRTKGEFPCLYMDAVLRREFPDYP
jgi:hypothetical protein